MNWIPLQTAEQLTELEALSHQQPVLIFKHSTRCSISSTALARFERQWKSEQVGELAPYFLDLIAYRPISAQVAEVFQVQHESPQLLLIHQGKCLYHASHFDISFEAVREALATLEQA